MITFADYMDRVLYGPAGYYSTGTAQSGQTGDYFTAPDVGPVFGRLLAEIFKAWKAKLDSDSFTLIEAGAGKGRLAKDILKCHPFRYVAVERSAARREHLKNMEVYPDLSAVKGAQGVLFANELIDAFPVHRVQFKDGRLRELFVEETGEKRRFMWGPPSTPDLGAYFDRLGVSLPEGYETEVNLGMSGWMAEAARALEKGLIVLIDYGRPALDYYAPERTRGTLRCFYDHKVIDPFNASSPAVSGGGSIDTMMGPRQGHSGATSLDWTSDVDFTSLALDARSAGFTPLAFMELGTFLMLGAAPLLTPSPDFVSGEGRDEGTSLARPSPHPSPAFRGRGGLRYLLHPEGMGSAFHVIILGKGIDTGSWTFENNRLSRLGLEKWVRA
jgi:SAM-dependent MidA family methyltransferase